MSSTDTSGGRLVDDVAEAFRRCNELEAALRFYADHRNHSGVGISAVYRDGGHRARALLPTCPTCDGKGWVVAENHGDVERCRPCYGSGLEGVR